MSFLDGIGNVLSPTNPAIVEQNIQNWIRAGNGLVYATPWNSVTATNNSLNVCALSIFNPSNSGKSLLIYSIQTVDGGANSIGRLQLTTTDPSGGTGFTGTPTSSNSKAGGAATVASLSCSATAIAASVTVPGTIYGIFGQGSNTMNEVLTNGTAILLPSGVANGMAVITYVPTAGQIFGALVKAIEF